MFMFETKHQSVSENNTDLQNYGIIGQAIE
jgi:hypothetical protein